MITLSTALLLACSLLVGACGASQAGINSRLRLALHSPIQAAFISFLTGTLLLGVTALLMSSPWFAPGTPATLPWWAWLGGLLGAFNVTMAVYLAPKLGALTLALSIICGQVLASVVLDHNGWLGYPRIELSLERLLGAVLIVAGVLLVARANPLEAAAGSRHGALPNKSPGRYFLLACSIAVGCSLASQAGINAELRTALSSPVQAAFFSFLLGTLALALVTATTGRDWFRPGALAATPWWAWLGGFLGAFIVTMSVFLAPRLGALTLAIAIICGKVFASLVLDQQGWLGYPRVPLTTPRAIGTVLMVLGVLLVAAN
ncbi:MAG: DMT family transporter [Haliea sp.]|uniref:DMT family transporter n=1 Tax=Haliea sp. TaxID=1932666 RepID=UPI0032ECE1BC